MSSWGSCLQGVNTTPVEDLDQVVNTTPVENHAKGVNTTPVEDHAQGVNTTPVEDHAQGVNTTPVEDLDQGVNSTPGEDHAQGVNTTPVEDNAQGVNSTPVEDHAQGDNTTPFEDLDYRGSRLNRGGIETTIEECFFSPISRDSSQALFRALYIGNLFIYFSIISFTVFLRRSSEQYVPVQFRLQSPTTVHTYTLFYFGDFSDLVYYCMYKITFNCS